MRKYFFDSLQEAVLYLIFLSVVPVLSIYAQFHLDDKTMYVSYFVAGFSMTYDYIMLFKGKISKRLWGEALLASMCLVCTSVFGLFKLSSILSERVIIPYTQMDFILISILDIMLVINLLEFVMFLWHDYKSRYVGEEDRNSMRLMQGAQRV